jgi:hypothetical protein
MREHRLLVDIRPTRWGALLSRNKIVRRQTKSLERRALHPRRGRVWTLRARRSPRPARMTRPTLRSGFAKYLSVLHITPTLRLGLRSFQTERRNAATGQEAGFVGTGQNGERIRRIPVCLPCGPHGRHTVDQPCNRSERWPVKPGDGSFQASAQGPFDELHEVWVRCNCLELRELLLHVFRRPEQEANVSLGEHGGIVKGVPAGDDMVI